MFIFLSLSLNICFGCQKLLTHLFWLRRGPEVIKLFSCSNSTEHKISAAHRNLTKIPKNEEVSCFKFLRYCIYQANKC